MLRLTIIILSILFLAGISTNAQCPVMPAGFLCITQEAGNQAKANKDELNALKTEKIPALQEQVKVEQENVKKAQDTDKENQIKAANKLLDMSTKNGELVGENVQLKATLNILVTILDVAIKNSRAKKNGVFNF